ncbi:MAG: hypothetical protein J7K08_08020 [Thermoplasmata archaeon]|nr:hypothetical protein [Thermoplasmata archaeon]RLF53800.1 MAG: hypothetical protein DRN28_06545 [Thermoplasmata archaeon]RLF69116.1 MAG: hypothetical protein DRN35_06140 [Thermoplasmata archaeon]RLF69440.1 MAG: hypothetical protein DRN40_06575 [Thermoplasmata archaeon]RLF71640.1 MAG: hypothetical protein DRN55_07135 [Thermoplasmata archaeon]
MEEPICRIEITEEDDGELLATVQSELGGLREYKARDIETLLKILVNELQDEIDFAVASMNEEEGSLY